MPGRSDAGPDDDGSCLGREPPILASGIEIDRAMDLSPGGQGAAAAGLRLANDAGALDPLALGRNANGRAVRLRIVGEQLRTADNVGTLQVLA